MQFNYLKRRELIALIGGATAAWPFTARAQQTERLRRVGVLMSTLEGDSDAQTAADALIQALGALNWHNGNNLLIEWRWAGGDAALFERYAAELLAFGPELLLAMSSPSVEALRRRTSTIPIVFTVVVDPVGQGFVKSLARPGSNVTGFSLYEPSMGGKWLEILTQITPPVARVAVLYNPMTTPYAGTLLRTINEAAPTFAVAVQAAPVSDDAEIEATMAGLEREGHGGLLVMANSFTTVHRDTIVALAARHRLPALYGVRFFAKIGGLMAYGVDEVDLFRRAAVYVDRILKGEKATDLPVQAPTKFDFVVNLKTAKALGVTVAPSLLASADEVVE